MNPVLLFPVRQARFLLLLLIILTGVSLLSAPVAVAVSPVLLDKASSSELSGHLEQLVDPAGKLALPDILTPAVSASFKPPEGSLGRGYSSDVVWLRFTLIRREGFPENSFLRLLPPNIDHVVVYVQSGDSSLQSSSYYEIPLGAHIPFVQRLVRNLDLVAPLSLPLERPVQVYMRIQTDSVTDLSVAIHTYYDLERITYETIIFQSAYLGIALMIVVMNLIFFLRLGDRIYLYFALFVLSLYLNYLAAGGLLTLLRPYSECYYANYFTGVSFGATLLFSSLFSIRIFKLRFPEVCRYLLLLPFFGILSILSVPLAFYGLMIFCTVIGYFVLIVVTSWLSVRMVIKGEYEGLFYIAAFGISNLGYLVDALTQAGWIHFNWWSNGSVQLLSLFNMIMMFLVMTKRLRFAEKQLATAALDSEKRALALAGEMTIELQESKNQLEVLLVSERQAGEALRQSEEQFRSLFEDHSAVMLILDPETGNIVDANQAAADFYGWPMDQLCRMCIQEINTLSPEAVMAEMAKSRLMIQKEFSFQHRRADGSICDVEVFSNKIEVASKELIYSIIHDVTERKRYEQVNRCRISMLQMAGGTSIDDLLRATVEEAERLTESALGFVFFVEEDQATLSLQLCSTPGIEKNCFAEKKGERPPFGKEGVWSDIIKGQRAVMHNNGAIFRHCAGMPEHYAEVRRELLVPIIRNDGVVAIIGVGNKPHDYHEKDIEWVESLADQLWDIVAQKSAEEMAKKLQDQLQQSTKMEMIGHLAAGIVHEIKNLLNFLMINQYTLKDDFDDLVEFVGFYRRIIEKVDALPAVAKEIELLREKEQAIALDDLLRNISQTLENSNDGIERIKTISQGLQNYSFKNVTGQFCLYDLNKAIHEALLIGKSEYRSVATIALQLENLPMVLCDPSQINQVLLNLIINSTHAIQSQNRNSFGKIEVKTWATAESLFCSVADDGPGIPEEIKERIFEPLFTTKERGKGTGLGLSISRDIIVKKHHGTLSVDSSPGGGTIFTFSLPVEEISPSLIY